jgi:hypothetical protein
VHDPVRPAVPDPAPATAPEAARGARCPIHHGIPAVGACSGCGRALCLTCAIPVRGLLVGQECLPSFVDDAPALDAQPSPTSRSGDAQAILGFAVVLVASVLPWARFNDPRIFGAWSWGWPGLAPGAALGGVVAVILWRRRPLDARLEAGCLALLSLLAGAGAILYRVRPPLLDGSSLAPLLALLGAVIALVGAMRKAAALWLRS